MVCAFFTFKTAKKKAKSIMVHCIQAQKSMNERMNHHGTYWALCWLLWAAVVLALFWWPSNWYSAGPASIQPSCGNTHTSSLTRWRLEKAYALSNYAFLAACLNSPHFCSHFSFKLLLRLHLDALVQRDPSLHSVAEAHSRTKSEACCVTNNLN